MTPDQSSDHTQRNLLTTILGNTELLQRWVARTTSLSDPERTIVAQQITDILEAAQSLRLHQQSPPPATEES